MSNYIDDEVKPNPDYHLGYDTVEMTPEQYDALDVKPVPTPKTGRFNVQELFNLTEGRGDKEERKHYIASVLRTIPEKELHLLRHKWEFWARSNQLPPDGNWTYWLLLAGRGFGKTRTGAEWIHHKVESGISKRIALVAPTAADVRKVMVEGESGLIATAKPWNRPVFEPSKLQLVWPNGAIAQMFSAEEPERLRGPQCDTFWADELSAWKKLQETWDMLMFGFRLGKNPQGCITTTPKPVPIVKELVKDHNRETKEILDGLLEEKTIVLTKGSTYDNAGNLATPFFNKVVAKYEGTRLGRQELEAEILEDMPGALWNRPSIDSMRVKASVPPITGAEVLSLVSDDEPLTKEEFTEKLSSFKDRAHLLSSSIDEDLSRIVVAVDPNASNNEGSDEIGIVVSAKGVVSGRGYVLADMSIRGTPNEWASVAVLSHDLFNADRIIGEANQGGNMVEHTVNSAAKFLRIEGKRSSDYVAITMVHATRGKVTRAEPVSALYEQNRIHHVGTHSTLEDQMCLFTSDFDRKAMGYSPDRVDALVWSLTHLFLEQSDTGILEHYHNLAVSKGIREKEKENPELVKMKVPSHITRVFGKTGLMYKPDKGFAYVNPEDVPGLRGVGLIEVA